MGGSWPCPCECTAYYLRGAGKARTSTRFRLIACVCCLVDWEARGEGLSVRVSIPWPKVWWGGQEGNDDKGESSSAKPHCTQQSTPQRNKPSSLRLLTAHQPACHTSLPPRSFDSLIPGRRRDGTETLAERPKLRRETQKNTLRPTRPVGEVDEIPQPQAESQGTKELYMCPPLLLRKHLLLILQILVPERSSCALFLSPPFGRSPPSDFLVTSHPSKKPSARSLFHFDRLTTRFFTPSNAC